MATTSPGLAHHHHHHQQQQQRQQQEHLDTRSGSLKEYENFLTRIKEQGPPQPKSQSNFKTTTSTMTMEPVLEQQPLGTPPRAPATSNTHGYNNSSQPAAVTPTGGTSIISGISEDDTFGGPSPEASSKLGDDSVNVDEALLDLAQLEELHQEAERMKALGNKHMAAQEYTRAYNAYSAALQLSPVGPSSHVFLSNRSAALLSLKRYSAAATDARRAIALAPTFGKAHARLGQSLYFLKDYEGAVGAYEDAIHYEPDNTVTRTYLEKAKTKLQRQQEKAARASRGEEVSVLTTESSVAHTVQNSIATDPNASAAVVQTMGFRGQSNAMVKAVGKGLGSASVGEHTVLTIDEEDPDFDEALRIQERANKYLAGKNYKFAIEEYTAALFLVPDDENLSPDLHLGRAHALNGSRRHESAKIDAQLAIRIKPSPEAYSTLAKSLFYMKDYQGAVDTFKVCKDLLPAGEALSMFDRAYLRKAEAALVENLSVDGGAPSPPSQTSTAPIPKLKPPRFVSREEALARTPNIPTMPKQWPQQSPRASNSFQCAEEREVLFLSEALGIKLNRGPDGIVRVIDVSPEVAGSPIARQGNIEVGDVIREAAGVDIRRPITNIMWGDTVALIKMAPRPIVLTVAKELSAPPPSILEQRRAAAASTLSPSQVAALNGASPQGDANRAFFPSNSSGDESVRNTSATIASTEEQTTEVVLQNEDSSVGEIYPPEGATDGEEARVGNVLDGNAVAAEVTEPQKDNSDAMAAVVEGFEVKQTDEQDIPHMAEEEEMRPTDEDEIVEPTTSEIEAVQTDETKTQDGVTADGAAEASTPVAQEGSVDQENLSLRDQELNAIGAEIMFERKPKAAYNGWDNLRWMSYSGVRKISFCEPLYRFVAGRKTLFWSGDQYLDRTLAIYEEPNLILVLRRPSSLPEIREFLDLPDGATIEDPEKALMKFVIVESVVDPNTCKLRLSPLTTVTSVLPGVNRDDHRRRSCFELLTPTETLVLSAVRLRKGAERALTSFDDSGAFLETSSVEFALKKALCDAHSLKEKSESNDLSWKHQIIVGTLHSYVVLGNQKQLQMAIAEAMRRAKREKMAGEEGSRDFLDPRVVDALDENGRSPLHYACFSRSSAAVAMLADAGANVDLRTEPNNMTPCHLCSQLLDDKGLAAILSANRRPNSIDSKGRTPMYVAITDGRAVGGKRDHEALGRCLTVLESHGGQLVGSDLNRHPVSHLASECRAEDLSVLLNHVRFRYPLPLDNAGDRLRGGISLSAFYQYPVHSCLVSLRKRVMAACSRETEEHPVDEFVAMEEPVVRTLEALFRRGFEPNERIERLVDCFEGADELALHTGYAPIQILAASAIDASSNKEILGEVVFASIVGLIASAAESLVKHGARVSLDEPPTIRSMARKSSSKWGSSVGNACSEVFHPVDRSHLKIQSNKELEELLGMHRLKSAQVVWNAVKNVKSTGLAIIHQDTKAAIEDCEAPGGSDEKNCFICWKPFGTIMNRRHRCRISKRHVCDECSLKRIVENGEEHRISDGQFLLARQDEATEESRRLEAERDQERRRRSGTHQQHAGTAAARLARLEAEEHAQRDSLFGGVVENMAKAVFGGDSVGKDGAASAANEVLGLSASLGQTRDALNERGDKLNSLAEKSDKLVNASKDFASMAKELNQASRNQGLFW